MDSQGSFCVSDSVPGFMQEVSSDFVLDDIASRREVEDFPVALTSGGSVPVRVPTSSSDVIPVSNDYIEADIEISPISVYNHPEVLRLNKFVIEFGSFLRTKGISMNEFNEFQSQAHGRKMDDLGFVQPKVASELINEFNRANGVLCITNSTASTGETASTSSSGGVPLLSWKNVAEKNSNPPRTQFNDDFLESTVIDNGDGTATISLPRSFLEEARKQWDSSCIGHFVGGSFSFKYVKEQTLKLWGNSGLKDVFYNSKGYFTFKFETVDEMKRVLALISVGIGGKRLYLAPWSDGSQFQRNVIPCVSTWIKLVDVPHSLWSWKGLGSIAKAVGKPLTLDKQTALLKPMKYAGVLVELKYGASCPRAIMVPVINEKDGTVTKMTVGVEYTAIPLSCGICRAFGHSESRCSKNNASQNNTSQNNNKDQAESSKQAGKRHMKPKTFMGCLVEMDSESPETQKKVKSHDENKDLNREPGEYVPDISPEIQEVETNLETAENDNMEMLTGDHISVVEEEPGQDHHLVLDFTEYAVTEESEESTLKRSGGHNKRKQSKSKAKNGPWASTVNISSPVPQSPSKKWKLTDSEGFTTVITKRSLRSQGKVIKNQSF